MKTVLIALCLLLPALARGGSVTLAWEASPGANIDHYALTYGNYGQSEDQTANIPAAAINADGESYQITLTLSDDKAYEASVVAVDTSGATSPPSNMAIFQTDAADGIMTPIAPPSSFFTGANYLGNGVSFLNFANGNDFGYYGLLADPHYIYHFDLGYEYVFDAGDGKSGVYFYDYVSRSYFYTSPTFSFPYLYDYSLNTVLYYYPDPNSPGHYNSNGRRYFYDFTTGEIITK